MSRQDVVPAFVVLAAKLAVPRLQSVQVPRPRLFTRLHAGLHARLTLVAAPAGFGKTTLLAQLLASRSNELKLKSSGLSAPERTQNSALIPHNLLAAWLSLDANDDQPVRFWRYLIAALQTALPELGGQALVLLDEHEPLDTVVASLLNDCLALPADLALVIDDYQHIGHQAIHALVAEFLQHLPPRLHVYLSSRSAPPLPLARLRVRGELAELYAADLCFTPDEIARYLPAVGGLHLAPEELAALHTHTEGWAAGLQLAVLAARGQPNPARVAASFTGSHHYAVEYITDEILRHSPALGRFLLHTAILDRLSAPLCDAVTGEPDSQAMLDQLGRQLLIEPIDNERHWYRYHTLLAAALREQLHRHSGELIQALHSRASIWYADQGMEREAVSHALAAHDLEWAATLIDHAARTIFLRGELATVRRWLGALPEALIAEWPQLCILQAWVLISQQRAPEAEPWLAQAEQTLAIWRHGEATPPPEVQLALGRVAATRAALAMTHGDVRQAIDLSQRALELLPPADRILRGLIAFNLATAFQTLGDAPEASHALELAHATSRSADDAPALLLRAGLAMLQGQLHEAAGHYRELIGRAETQPPDAADEECLALAYIGQGELLYEWNELAEAGAALQASLAISERREAIGARLAGLLLLACVRQAQADSAEAAGLLGQALALAEQQAIASQQRQALALAARLALHAGDLAAAAKWADHYEVRVAEPVHVLQEAEYLTLAEIAIARGQVEPALGLLAQLQRSAQPGGRRRGVVANLALQALARRAAGDTAQALDLLRRALLLAAPDGYIRTFADLGAPLRALLAELRRTEGQPRWPGAPASYFDDLLAAFGAPPASRALAKTVPAASALPEPLTERELAVLRCLAAGLSNSEIGVELSVAVSTVRTHVKNIYAKLGVRNRVEAVTYAQTLGLVAAPGED